MYVNATREKSTRRRGRTVMKPYKDLKDMFGLTLAKQIRETKKQQQLTKSDEEEDFWQVHPEVPDAED